MWVWFVSCSKPIEEDRDKRAERLAKEEEEYEQRQLERKKREREDAYREVKHLLLIRYVHALVSNFSM